MEFSQKSQKRQAFLVEAFNSIHILKQLALEKRWIRRYYDHSTSLSQAQSQSENINHFMTNISQLFMKVAGIITILWGAVRVMDEQMSVGTLVAIILLVWRALSPLQSLFMVIGRLELIRSGIEQMNQLMKLPKEQKTASVFTRPQLMGLVRFHNIYFRYPTDSILALNGVTMEAKPGEVVGIIGPNGSGKSTLIKLLLGFYHPQSGHISLDGAELHHYDLVRLRQLIGYVPNEHQFFHGTIAQNLRLAEPDVEEKDLIKAVFEAGVLNDILVLPKGFETHLNVKTLQELSFGFKQKLNLARAYIRKSKLLVLDEPGNALDIECDQILRNVIEKKRGKTTIIFVTHRPSMMRLADRILVLDKGQMRVFGPRDKVLSYLEGKAA
ncbi:MAG: ATP-binding cassette domain-containing protein [Proteobacteria bacterium]|nr:ATP-binding cassette domain-containing protein [Pseudomonadota bacterium]